MINWNPKIGVSIAAGLMIIAHLSYPNIEIDALTIGLLIIAFLPWVLPWVASLIESAKFPGGLEIKLRDMQRLSSEVVSQTETSPDRTPTLIEVAQFDAHLALVYLRIEIERRLRMLAQVAGLNHQHRGIIHLFRELRRSGAIDHPLFSVLQEFVDAGNRAAHGASVEPSLREWAMEYGPQIIDVLDQVLKQRGISLTGPEAFR